jgi:hypothetical protein
MRERRCLKTGSEKAEGGLLKTVSRQMADQAGKLVLNVLWSYVTYQSNKEIDITSNTSCIG